MASSYHWVTERCHVGRIGQGAERLAGYAPPPQRSMGRGDAKADPGRRIIGHRAAHRRASSPPAARDRATPPTPSTVRAETTTTTVAAARHAAAGRPRTPAWPTQLGGQPPAPSLRHARRSARACCRSRATSSPSPTRDRHRPAGRLPGRADAGQRLGGVAIDPAEWNRNDGFSPNTPILTYVDGVDPAGSALPSWTDLGASLADDSPVVLVDMATGERIPLWAELDAKAAETADRLLVIHPAVPLAEGHHYAVALRGLVRADGRAVDPSAAFRAYRDRIGRTRLARGSAAAMEDTFAALGSAGIARADLFLAWNFTVASTRNVAERMLGIRDDAPRDRSATAPDVHRRRGRSGTPTPTGSSPARSAAPFEVPNYLSGDGGAGQRLLLRRRRPHRARRDPATERHVARRRSSATSRPSRSTAGADADPSRALRPRAAREQRRDRRRQRAADGQRAQRGLLRHQVGGDERGRHPQRHRARSRTSRRSRTVADRLQQGVLNAIFLGRLMTARPGITSRLSSFAGVTLDLDHLDFDGNSQGGIMGLMLTAVSPDIERAVLGVPGMNYSLLLPRSVDFDDYESVFAAGLPERPRPHDHPRPAPDAVGSRRRCAATSNTSPPTPIRGRRPRRCCSHVALGDHQVTQLAALDRGAGPRRPVPRSRSPRRAGCGADTVTFGLEPIADVPLRRVGDRAVGLRLARDPARAVALPRRARPPRGSASRSPTPAPRRRPSCSTTS